jgi:hypothetical protein
MVEIDQDKNLPGPHQWRERLHSTRIENNHVGLRHGMWAFEYFMPLGFQSSQELGTIRYDPEFCDA